MRRRIPYRLVALVLVGVVLGAILVHVYSTPGPPPSTPTDHLVWNAAKKTLSASELSVSFTSIPAQKGIKPSSGHLVYHAPDQVTLYLKSNTGATTQKKDTGKQAMALLSNLSVLPKIYHWHQHGSTFTSGSAGKISGSNHATANTANIYTVVTKNGYVISVVHEDNVTTAAGAGIGSTFEFKVSAIDSKRVSVSS